MSVQQLITDHLDLWTGAVTQKSTSGRGTSSGNSGKIELTGIRKLRELILELAVRGKLVEQDPNDEPASVLLERIAEEKARLVKEGKIKEPKKLPEVAEEEKPFALPSGWAWARMHNALNKITDGTHRSPPNHDSGDFMYISAKNIKPEGVVKTGVTYVTSEIHEEIYSRCNPEPGDLLYIKDGATTGIATINNLKNPFSMLSSVALLKPQHLLLHNKYLLYCLTSPFFYEEMRSGMTGVAITRITLKKLDNAIIPIPPVEEQHRIVEKVGELMALCDRLEQQVGDQLEAHDVLVDTLLDALTRSDDAAELAENWARVAEHFDTLFTTEASIDKLKRTILQLAVMGRLVPQGTNDEPASVLLERIAEEKARLVKEGKIKKQKHGWEISQDALPALPKTWRWAALGELVIVMDAGWSPACPPESAGESEWGVLKTTSVQVMSYLQNENKRLPDNKEPKTQYEVHRGDILITRAGPKNRVGISCWVDQTRPRLIISDKIIRFHLIDTAMSEPFICLCLNSGMTNEYLENAKSGMAESQVNISQDKLKAAPIPLCPANEQHRIVAKVDELMVLCDQLKARLGEAGETRTQLAEAVVEQAVS